MGRRNKGCGRVGQRFWGGVGRGLGYVMIYGARRSLCPAAPLALPPLLPLRCSIPPACCVVGGRDGAGRGRAAAAAARCRLNTDSSPVMTLQLQGWMWAGRPLLSMHRQTMHLTSLCCANRRTTCNNWCDNQVQSAVIVFFHLLPSSRWRSWRGAAPGPGGLLPALLLAWPWSC